MSRPGAALDWEWFLYDVDPATPPPPVAARLRRYAVARTATALRILRRQGWGEAYPYLRRLSPGPGAASYASLAPAAAVRLARREIFVSQLVVRALAPQAMCLPRSLALTTYLRALGLPAEVTLARTLSTGRPRDSFHSWTELHGTVLNDKQDVVLAYAVLQREPSTTGR